MLSSNTSAVSGGDTTYVEDVFSTYLYTGTSAAQTINNGIALGPTYGGSLYFAGSDAKLSIATSASLKFGASSMCVEAWVNPTTTPSNSAGQIIGDWTTGASAGPSNWSMYYTGTAVIFNAVNAGNNYSDQGSTTLSANISQNVWTHIAVSFDGTTLRLFINGALAQSSSYSGFSTSAGSYTANIEIGDFGGLSGYSYIGHISNLRVVKGSAVYTSAFTPSTIPLTAISGTSLLTCTLPDATKDYSSSPFNITVSGQVSQIGGGPFTDAALGKGGMVWTKSRSNAINNIVVDSVRGGTNALITDLTAANSADTGYHISNFNSNGYSLQGAGSGDNYNGYKYVSWTFRKQPKFFDVVTYTGNGSSARDIAHSLGSTPGCVMVKCTSSTGPWIVWHRSMGGNNYIQYLNNTDPRVNGGAPFWNNTAPTSTVFTVGNDSDINRSGYTYVAYLFAHEAGGFGLTGTDNVISCGSVVADGREVTLGWEPQWILFKSINSTDVWRVTDNMRGMTTNLNTAGANPWLYPNGSDAEVTGGYGLAPTATGFKTSTDWSGYTYIYIAIRRGPMKVPTDGTAVFQPSFATSGNPEYKSSTVKSGFDMAIGMYRPGYSDATMSYPYIASRLTGAGKVLQTTNTRAEYNYSSAANFAHNTGWFDSTFGNDTNRESLMFKRAPSFFDVVCSAGTSSSNEARTHNLKVIPELIIVKDRTSGAANWTVYVSSLGQSKYLNINNTNAAQTSSGVWGTTANTATTFYCNDTANWCASTGNNGVFYLFATCAGVSKVGSFTNTGTTLNIDCGFTSGARFLLFKRTNTTGGWFVYDTTRGINTGTDPGIALNSASAEYQITDDIDTYASGFTFNGANWDSADYIYLAIA